MWIQTGCIWLSAPRPGVIIDSLAVCLLPAILGSGLGAFGVWHTHLRGSLSWAGCQVAILLTILLSSSRFFSMFPHKPCLALWISPSFGLERCFGSSAKPGWLIESWAEGYMRVRWSLPYQGCLLNVVSDSQLGSLAIKQVETISCCRWCYVPERLVP